MITNAVASHINPVGSIFDINGRNIYVEAIYIK
jgi:hypothetical protein